MDGIQCCRRINVPSVQALLLGRQNNPPSSLDLLLHAVLGGYLPLAPVGLNEELNCTPVFVISPWNFGLSTHLFQVLFVCRLRHSGCIILLFSCTSVFIEAPLLNSEPKQRGGLA